MNRIETELTEEDRRVLSFERKSSSSLAEDILDSLRMAAPYHVTFIDGVPAGKKQEVEEELRRRFEIWANTWIAPKCRQIIGKARKGKEAA